jgi:hypothetical protein
LERRHDRGIVRDAWSAPSSAPTTVLVLWGTFYRDLAAKQGLRLRPFRLDLGRSRTHLPAQDGDARTT